MIMIKIKVLANITVVLTGSPDEKTCATSEILNQGK